MAERPILMNAPMVRATKAGLKTQTRRLETNTAAARIQVGDLLWVREAWRVAAWKDGGCIAVDYRASPKEVRTPWLAVPEDQWDRLWLQSCFDANQAVEAGAGSARREGDGWKWERGDSPCRWRPSIHMPRWASRITLEVTAVRVEPLQAITEEDALAEGVGPLLVAPDGGSCPHIEGFRQLWNSINGPGSWEANPKVRVVSFRGITA